MEIKYDENTLSEIKKKLGSAKSEAPKVLKDAVNDTAKQIRKELAVAAQNVYTIKNGGFNKAMKIKGATVGKPEAIIRSKGEPIELKKFKISKSGGTVKAQVLKVGGLKPLIKGDIKAFANNIAARGQVRKRNTDKGIISSEVKHAAIAQRMGKKRLKIKTFYSNSIPVMLGNEKRVFNAIQPSIERKLWDNLERHIKKVLEA